MTDPLANGEPSVSDEQRAESADAQEWQRLHPLSPLLRGGLVLIVIIGILIANLRDRIFELFVAEEFSGYLGPDSGDLIDFLIEQRLLIVVLLAVLGALLLIVLFAWLSWRFSSYRITTEAVYERSGVLFRQHRQAPLDRVQSVNLQRPLLARAVGLTQVNVLTGGQGGTVSLRYLSHGVAKQVRERILHDAAAVQGRQLPGGKLEQRARDFIDTDIAPEAAAAQSLVSVPIGRLIGSVLLGWEFVVPLAIGIGCTILGTMFSPFFLLLLVPFALAVVSIAFGQINRGFQFVLSRSGEGVRVGAGLTSTVTETLPLNRIHAVEARQPLLWRPFGWWQVRITTAGHAVTQGGQNKLQNRVLPVGTVADVHRVLGMVMPWGFGEATLDEFRDELLGSGAAYRGAGARAAWVLWFGRRRAGILLARDADAATHDERAVVKIRRGALTRSLSAMAIVRAQSVQLSRPLMHRALGLAAVQAHTVLGPVRMEMRGLNLGQACGLFDELAATAVRAQASENERKVTSG